MPRLHRLLPIALAMAVALAPPAAAQSFVDDAGIFLPDPSGPTPAPASIYPSTITVSGLVRPIDVLRVHIADSVHVNPDDVDMLLVSPTGVRFGLWSDARGTSTQTRTYVHLTDAAVGRLPDSETMSNHGSREPADWGVLATDTYPAPAPPGPYHQAASTGSATLASLFHSMLPAQANGVWSLYVVDDTDNGEAGAITCGWLITIDQAWPALTGAPRASELDAAGPGGDERFVGPADASGVTAGAPGVAEGAERLLAPPRPNPTGGLARLELAVARSQHVVAELVDALGRRVAVLHDGPVAAGEPRALVADGRALPPGVYLVRARGERFAEARPLTIAR